MGYSCRLKSVNKNIDVRDIDRIIETLPQRLCGPFGNTRQSWGWSCGCDVYKPEDNTLIIGGSYSISGDIADDFVSYFKNELEQQNYNIHIEWDW